MNNKNQTLKQVVLVKIFPKCHSHRFQPRHRSLVHMTFSFPPSHGEQLQGLWVVGSSSHQSVSKVVIPFVSTGAVSQTTADPMQIDNYPGKLYRMLRSIRSASSVALYKQLTTGRSLGLFGGCSTC